MKWMIIIFTIHILTNERTAVGIKSIKEKWSMNVNINEEEPKLTLEEQKMRSKHSFAGDKQKHYKICISHFVSPSISIRVVTGTKRV